MKKSEFLMKKKRKKRAKIQFLRNFVWNKKVKKLIKKVNFYDKKRK